MTNGFDFNEAYEALSSLYSSRLLEKKKHNAGGKSDVAKKPVDSWLATFTTFKDLKIPAADGQFKPLASEEFVAGFNAFRKVQTDYDIARLLDKLGRIVASFEPNGRSKIGESEKINGVDYPAYELKIGETSTHKPIRAIYFTKTGEDGQKYVIFASLFLHTEKRLTNAERNSGRGAYLAANPRK